MSETCSQINSPYETTDTTKKLTRLSRIFRKQIDTEAFADNYLHSSKSLIQAKLTSLLMNSR